MVEAVLMAFAIVLFFLIRRWRKSLQNKTTMTRKIWVRPIFQEEARRADSQYYNLVKELGLGDREYYFLPSIRFHLVIFKMEYRWMPLESSSLISGCICSSTHSTSSATTILKIVLEQERLGLIFLRCPDWFFVIYNDVNITTIKGNNQFFPYVVMSMSFCCCYVVMSTCSHLRHNNLLTSFVMSQVWTRLKLRLNVPFI